MHKYNLEYWGCNRDLVSRAFIFRCSEPQSLRCGAHSHKVPAVNIKKVNWNINDKGKKRVFYGQTDHKGWTHPEHHRCYPQKKTHLIQQTNKQNNSTMLQLSYFVYHSPRHLCFSVTVDSRAHNCRAFYKRTMRGRIKVNAERTIMHSFTPTRYMSGLHENMQTFSF